MQEFCCRVAPSLGELEGTHQEVWGTKEYDPTTDINKPTVFFGLYGLPDFYALWRHKGPKYILWAGSDIRHFKNGYWLDDSGEIRLSPVPLAEWIHKNCEVWVENNVEKDALSSLGLISYVCPSFMGDIKQFNPPPIITCASRIGKKNRDKNTYYSSVSGNDFQLYQWDKIARIALDNPDNEYHMYGNTRPYPFVSDNFITHGRVPKEQMNEEIKGMTGAIRLVEFDGCSEIVVKAVLMGQEVISAIDYPFLKSDNPREELLKVLNKYPWAQKSL